MKSFLIFLVFLLSTSCSEPQNESTKDTPATNANAVATSTPMTTAPSGIAILNNPDSIYQIAVTEQHPWPADGSLLLDGETLAQEFQPAITEQKLGDSFYVYVLHYGEVSPASPLLSGQFIVSKENTRVLESPKMIIFNQLIQDRSQMYQRGEGFLSVTLPPNSVPGIYTIEANLYDHVHNIPVELVHTVKMVSEEELKTQRLSKRFPVDFHGTQFNGSFVVSSDSNLVSKYSVAFPENQFNDAQRKLTQEKLKVGDSFYAGILLRTEQGLQRQLHAQVTYRLYDPKGQEIAKLENSNVSSLTVEKNASVAILSSAIMAIQTANFTPGSYLITAEISGFDVPQKQTIGKRLVVE